MSLFFNIVLNYSYPLIICFLSRLRAANENRVIFVSLSVSERLLFSNDPFSEATAIHIVPTGFLSVPPPGPAIPDVATEKSVLNQSPAPSAILFTTFSLTAP